MSDRAAYNTLSHWVDTTPHFISDTMFPVGTVSNILVICCRIRTLNVGGKKKQKNNYKTLRKIKTTKLVVQLTGVILFSLQFPVGRPKGVDSLSKILSAVGTPCKFTIMQHSHVLHRAFNLTLFPCFNQSTSPSHLPIQLRETNIECGTIH